HLRRAEQDEKDIIEGYRRIAEILEELQPRMWTIAEQQLAVSFEKYGYFDTDRQRGQDSRPEALLPAHVAAYNSSLSEEVNAEAATEGPGQNILLELNEWSLDSSKPNISSG
ncbi:hypothetical protein RhiTH_010021, partial [Rhizoctonia solani]